MAIIGRGMTHCNKLDAKGLESRDVASDPHRIIRTKEGTGLMMRQMGRKVS